MKQYQVSYKLGKMYHTYLVSADNEAEAIKKAINRIPCPEILSEFRINEYIPNVAMTV
jgi:hypothetical protein